MLATRVLFCLIGISFFGLIGSGAADDPKDGGALKEDLRKLEGKWEHTFKDKDGKALVRKVKEVKGNTEKVTWYLPDGTVHMVNTVDFKLEMRGKDKVFSYFNGKVVEGPAKGQEFQSGSFVYTLDGDTWTEVTETGEKFPWRRVKEDEKK